MIHETAIIDPLARISEGVTIGPWTLIGPDVEIETGTVVGPHVVIKGPTRIGRDNQFFQFSSIGEDPQDKKYNAEPTELIIGERNIFRECVTVHRGTVQGNLKTEIGNDNLFMAYTHIAHDCIIGDHVIFSNNASVAGHVTVADYAYLGGLSGVHQHCAIGAHSFTAAGTIVLKDVPPFITVSGHPAETFGLNTVGLERRGFPAETIHALRRAYKIIFRTSLTLADALQELKAMELIDEVQWLIDFLENSRRGIIR